MTTPPDLSSNIQGNATGPQTATADGVTFTQQPLLDQIAADKYLAAKQANQGPPFGIVIAGVIAPSAQGNSWSGSGQMGLGNNGGLGF